MEEILNRLEKRFEVKDKKIQRPNLAFITVPKDELIQVLTLLRDLEGFRHLVIISVVDWIERDVFQLTYILHNYSLQSDIGVIVEIDRNEAVMDSIHHLWAAARVYQQEIREMYGIDFPGSPRVDEPFILEGWDNIPPMRRDFDTKKYAEETFFPREGRYSLEVEKVLEEKAYPLEAEVKKKIRQLLRGKEEKRNEG